MLNVSEGGMYFMTREDLPIGQKINFKIEAQNMDGMLAGVAEVRWTTKSSEHDAYKVGVSFEKMSDKSKGKLKKLLEDAVLDKIDYSTSIYLRDVERL